MIERDALLQPSYSECEHHMPAKHKPEVWVWPLGSKFATSGLCFQVQAPAHSSGGICDQAPDNSRDTFPATRCSRNTKLVLTLFFHEPMFLLMLFLYLEPHSTPPFYHHLHLANSNLFFSIQLRSYQVQGSSSG